MCLRCATGALQAVDACVDESVDITKVLRDVPLDARALNLVGEQHVHLLRRLHSVNKTTLVHRCIQARRISLGCGPGRANVHAGHGRALLP